MENIIRINIEIRNNIDVKNIKREHEGTGFLRLKCYFLFTDIFESILNPFSKSIMFIYVDSIFNDCIIINNNYNYNDLL